MLKRTPVDPDKLHLAPIPRRLLTITEAAAVLNVGQSSLYNLIEREGLPYITVNGAKQIPITGLDTWLMLRLCSTQMELQEHLRTSITEKPEKAPDLKQGTKRRTSQTKTRKTPPSAN